MNHILKLKHCRYFLRKMYRNSFKFNKQALDIGKQFEIHSMLMTDLNPMSSICSYQQIREYASRGIQGKQRKSGKAKMHLTDEEMADVIDIDDYRQKLDGVAERLKKDYAENLSIRSAVGNIENIIVTIDGEEYPLNELAVISKKNPTLIAINMSDFPECLKPAIQAIINSGSGFNPQQDGTMIYLNIPKMTREHRETLAKNAKTLYMKAKDEIRSLQNSCIKEAKEKTDLSEDVVYNATSQIKMMAEHCVTNLEIVLKAKQKELLGDG